MFADLSGFTALSEKLAVVGRIGAEKLAGIINDCFSPLLEIVFYHNGDVIKFGGDSFLVFFTGDDHIKRAFTCGRLLISWVDEHGRIATPEGEIKLGIHVGLSAGKPFNLLLGKPGGRRDHLFCGPAVEQAYAAADKAGLGEMVITGEAARVLNLSGAKEIEGGFSLYEFSALPEEYGRCRRKSEGKLKKIPAEMSEFLIVGLEDLLSAGGGTVEGEHRILTSLFIGVESLRRNLEKDSAMATAALADYFDLINNALVRFEGALGRIDSTPAGEKILAFFGAPKSSGRDAANALRAALQIERGLEKVNRIFPIPVKHRYGINTGVCYVGDVGGHDRREYTAMGDAINLAARLMSKADPGRILCGEQTVRLAGRGFNFAPSIDLQVKGKTKSVVARPLIGYEGTEGGNEDLVGREHELNRGMEFVRRTNPDTPKVLAISGEPGIGKSAICARLISYARQIGLKVASGACFKGTEQVPYEPLTMILCGLLDLKENSTSRERHQALHDLLSSIEETDWEPLLAPLLDYSLAVPLELANLPDNIKQDKIRSLICRLIAEVNRKHKSLIFIEDIQWIDNATFEILRNLQADNDSPPILLAVRPSAICEQIKGWPNTELIELGHLAPLNSRRLFLAKLAGRPIEESLVDRIVEKSAGNPFYLEEMARAFAELGPEKIFSGDGIPTSIEAVITARIDNLEGPIKRTLRAASVIGRIFALKVLQAIHPDSRSAGVIRNHLRELSGLDLTPLERNHPIVEYIFKHILTQEVAYNGLSFAIRRDLHRRIADYYAGKKSGRLKNPELPARHYLLAGSQTEALPYLFMAAQKASARFATVEAMEFYDQAMAIARNIDDRSYLLEISRQRGKLAKQIGDYDKAIADFNQLKSIGENDEQVKESLQELSEIYRTTAAYETALKTIEELETSFPNDFHVKAFCLDSRGTIERRLGNLQRSLVLHSQAEEIFREHELPSAIQASVHNNIGICLWTIGELEKAESHYKKALTLYRRLKDLHGQSKVINNLGIISDKAGKLKKAAAAYTKAEKIFKRIGAARSQALACANLGTNLTSRGYLGEAMNKLNEALNIFRRIGDRHCLALSFGDLGYAMFYAGRFEGAIANMEKSIELANELGENELATENSIRLNRMLLLCGREVNRVISDLAAKGAEIGSKELEANARILQAWHALFNGNLEPLKESLAVIRREFAEIESLETRLEIEEISAALTGLMGDYSAAAKIIDKAIACADRNDLVLSRFELGLLAAALPSGAKIRVKSRQKTESAVARIESSLSLEELAGFKSFAAIRTELLAAAIMRKPPQPAPKLLVESHR